MVGGGMKRSVISLCLLALVTSFGCKSEKDTPPDPLATRVGFCQAWAERACSEEVVADCNARTTAACQDTQSDFCLGIIPENYSSAHAKECLDAVGDAYADGNLTADELAVVLKLAEPCDKLSSGTQTDGESCRASDECDTAGGFTCITKAGAKTGACGKPEEVAAGEACDGPAQVCRDGYFCNGENCVVYKKTGASCEGDYMCKPEDRCVIETDATSGTCEARAELSEDCKSDDDCQSHYCSIEEDSTSGICAARIRLGVHEPLCANLR